jgi:hypothetical protein
MKADVRETIRQTLCPAIVAASLMLLQACSSAEDDVYQAFKCAKVASTMGLGQKATAALTKVKPQLEKLQQTHQGGPQNLLAELNAKVRSDLNLDNLDGPRQAEAIVRTVASNRCEKLYQ